MLNAGTRTRSHPSRRPIGADWPGPPIRSRSAVGSAAAWSSNRARLLVCTSFRARPQPGPRPALWDRLGRLQANVGSPARPVPSYDADAGAGAAGRRRARVGVRARPPGRGPALPPAYACTARGHAARAGRVGRQAAFPAARRSELRPGSQARGRLRHDGPAPDPQHPTPSSALCGRQTPERGPPRPRGDQSEMGEREVGAQTPWRGDGRGRTGSAVSRDGRMPGDAAEAALTFARPRSPNTLTDGAENSMNSRLFRYT